MYAKTCIWVFAVTLAAGCMEIDMTGDWDDGIDTTSQEVGLKQYEYQVVYTSMKCLRESDENSSSDEVYALFIHDRNHAGFGQLDRFRVPRTKLYTNVDEGENKGTNNTSDDKKPIKWEGSAVVTWDPSKSGNAKVVGDLTRLTIQVMENDDNSPSRTRINLAHDLPRFTAMGLGVYDSVKRSLRRTRVEGRADLELNGDDEVRYRPFPLREYIRKAIEDGGKSRKTMTFNGSNGEGKYQLRFSIYAREI